MPVSVSGRIIHANPTARMWRESEVEVYDKDSVKVETGNDEVERKMTGR